MLVNCPTQAKTGLEWGTREFGYEFIFPFERHPGNYPYADWICASPNQVSPRFERAQFAFVLPRTVCPIANASITGAEPELGFTNRCQPDQFGKLDPRQQ